MADPSPQQAASVDEDQLYGVFLRDCERRGRLSDMAARKALNLPPGDDMNITTHQHGRGGTLGTILGTVAAMAIGGGAVGAGLHALGLLKPHQTVVNETMKDKPYNVIFDVGEDGTVTPVEIQPRN